MGRRTLTRAQALTARAGRAHEDPAQMTADAYLGRLAKHVVAIIRLNPDLSDKQVAAAARLKLKAEMATLAEKSAAARAGRRAEVLDARGLANCGSDGVDPE